MASSQKFDQFGHQYNIGHTMFNPQIRKRFFPKSVQTTKYRNTDGLHPLITPLGLNRHNTLYLC